MSNGEQLDSGGETDPGTTLLESLGLVKPTAVRLWDRVDFTGILTLNLNGVLTAILVAIVAGPLAFVRAGGRISFALFSGFGDFKQTLVDAPKTIQEEAIEAAGTEIVDLGFVALPVSVIIVLSSLFGIAAIAVLLFGGEG